MSMRTIIALRGSGVARDLPLTSGCHGSGLDERGDACTDKGGGGVATLKAVYEFAFDEHPGATLGPDKYVFAAASGAAAGTAASSLHNHRWAASMPLRYACEPKRWRERANSAATVGYKLPSERLA